MYQPLADLLRPQTLDEVFGQEHILGKGAVLRRLIDSGNIPNMVFYGPSGTGKTTVANIIAKQTNRTLYKLNATTASTADLVVVNPDTNNRNVPTVFYPGCRSVLVLPYCRNLRIRLLTGRLPR